jgi:hypothetical protein
MAPSHPRGLIRTHEPRLIREVAVAASDANLSSKCVSAIKKQCCSLTLASKGDRRHDIVAEADEQKPATKEGAMQAGARLYPEPSLADRNL